VLLADDFNRTHFKVLPLEEKTSISTHNFAYWLHERDHADAGMVFQTDVPVNDPKVKLFRNDLTLSLSLIL